MSDSEKYQDYANQLDQAKAEAKVRKTLYISRRAIWANILLSMFVSYVAGYIHTRRWKALGIFLIGNFIVMMAIPSEDQSFEESFEQGLALSPIASLIGTIENSLAIRRARQEVAQADAGENG